MTETNVSPSGSVKETDTLDTRVRRMSRNVVLTVTAATALAFTGGGINGCKYSPEPKEEQLEEKKADHVTRVGWWPMYFYGGHGYAPYSVNSRGERFVPSASGKGGYFVKPGYVHTGGGKVFRSGYSSGAKAGGVPRGGFGGIGRGFSIGG